MAPARSTEEGLKAESFPQLVLGLLREIPGLISDRVQLLTLELQRARRALAQVIVLGVVVALLGLTAWFALWVGVAALLVEAGLGWGWALLAVMLLNVGAAALALVRVRRLSSLLTLPATVRRLTVAPESAAAAGKLPTVPRGGPAAAPAGGSGRSAAPSARSGATPAAGGDLGDLGDFGPGRTSGAAAGSAPPAARGASSDAPPPSGPGGAGSSTSTAGPGGAGSSTSTAGPGGATRPVGAAGRPDAAAQPAHERTEPALHERAEP